MFKVKILDNFCRSHSDITGLDNLKSHTDKAYLSGISECLS